MKIVFTGGGTAGHAMVNKALIPMMSQEGWETLYVGSHQGVENKMIKEQGIAQYFPISTGKLRRYLSWKNVTDVFRVLNGIREAYEILKKERPHVVFSGGGFVSVPVVLAAAALKIPVVIRETDVSVGLANKICMRFAKKVYVSFPDTKAQIKHTEVADCGILVRPELLEVSSPRQEDTDFPTILVMGGSLGSGAINQFVWRHLEKLQLRYDLIHVCGKGHVNPDVPNQPAYWQYGFVEDMGALYQKADIVVTRCGSNAINEGLALGKRMICIPFPSKFSRGEQKGNAEYAVRNGCAVILEEDQLTLENLIKAVELVQKKKINPKLILTKESLDFNCREQIAGIKSCAVRNLEECFARNIKKGKSINWKGLKDWEFRIYEELLEVYGE